MKSETREIGKHLTEVLAVAYAAFSRSCPDRTDERGALRSAVLALLGWAICEGQCIERALESKTPQGVAPNVRSMLEALITALYLTDDESVAPEESRDRLDRYFRGVRRAQVKLREAISEYPALSRDYLTDPELMKREEEEYRENEAGLPRDRRLGRHWSGAANGLRGVAESVGLGSDYAMQFRLYSGSLHCNRPWDHALFDPDSLLIVPSLENQASLGMPLAFDSLRYLAWLLEVALACQAVRLYRSEQETLAAYRKYMQPVETLHETGIVGAGEPDVI